MEVWIVSVSADSGECSPYQAEVFSTLADAEAWVQNDAKLGELRITDSYYAPGAVVHHAERLGMGYRFHIIRKVVRAATPSPKSLDPEKERLLNEFFAGFSK